jgi:fibronectin type 3 domain-containing protein
MTIVVAGLLGSGIFYLTARPARHSVDLTWDPGAGHDSSEMRYNVYRSTQPGGPYIKIASHVAKPEYTDWLIDRGRTYYYVVKAVDRAGRESNYSNETKAVIP